MQKVVFTYKETEEKEQYNHSKVLRWGCVVSILPFLILILLVQVATSSATMLVLSVFSALTIVGILVHLIREIKDVVDLNESCLKGKEFSYDPTTKTFQYKNGETKYDFTAEQIELWKQEGAPGNRCDIITLKNGKDIFLQEKMNDDIRVFLDEHAQELGIEGKRQYNI